MDEKALIDAARGGDLSAFNRLVLHYQGLVYNLAYRILGDGEAAADATQDAFVKAFRNLNQYRGGSFKGWLLRIVTNVCYDQLRVQRRRPTNSLEDLAVDAEHTDHLIDPAESPSDYALRQELAQVLQTAIQCLPPAQRMVLLLSDVEGLNYEEIALVMSISVGTVKSRLSRARAKLRDFLQENKELLPQRYRLKDDRLS